MPNADRSSPRRRSAIRNWTEYAAVLGVMKTLEWAPLGVANRLARAYARAFDRALPRLRRVALRNLALALPELGAAETRDEIVDGVFRSIARLMVSFAKFPSLHRGNVSRWIPLRRLSEHFESALRQGRGVLFATAHLGNWGDQRLRPCFDGCAYGCGCAACSTIP